MGLGDVMSILLKRLTKGNKRLHEGEEKGKKTAEVSGQTPIHILINILLQIALIAIFVSGVEHEQYPKTPSVPDYPGLGEPGGPIVNEPEPVIPFKRYPAGFDVVGPKEDGTLSARLSERILQFQYKYFVEIATYVYLGFALQYSFLRKFGYSTLSFGLLQATVAAQWAILWMQFIDGFHCSYLKQRIDYGNGDKPCTPSFLVEQITGSFDEIQYRQGCTCILWSEINANKSMSTELPHQAHHALLTVGKMNFDNTFIMTYPSMIEGLLATVPVQITYGMLLGKVGPSQLMLCALMCVTSYGINYWVVIYILGGWDHVGGSCVIHIFGSFFGIGCTLLASQKGSAQNPDNAPRYNADVLCIVGVILNWMTFPTFNAYFAPAAAQEAVVVNTYLALFSSCVAAMVFSSLYSGQFKLDPADVQRSAIAGGVAISSVFSIFATPYEAMVVGFVGGGACSTSHHYLRRFLEKKLQITDTVGAVSLHAVPAMVAWAAGIIKVANLDSSYMGKWSGALFGARQTRTLPYDMEYDLIFMHSEGNNDTAEYQGYLMPVTICIATVAGILTGTAARKVKGPSVARTFSDSIFWRVPDDFAATEDVGAGAKT
mmetsp:Transcript_13153/g.26277  ORF Transcript_13153/g.26277 Transcript_13153/m.26277 type:complete len:602 (+) Transcript_13153:188-1993(+)|eukprot:CAMPEP_0181305490 /NCGR_PEP_ID=MMETSP1101-20121128/9761_1 /TAXON_ID=46948 /ORGANISM="Rhodomonas abbreviata, Strain Caron Lab Isolate" /LENGTH=601 /DNA_ID=CAMNT_0023411417 /DNA_START=187 /DNA_END=1992 /DNA_ORIENTATION=+